MELKTQPSSLVMDDDTKGKSITDYIPCRIVPVIGTEVTCRELLSLLKEEQHIPCVIVVNPDGKPLGIIMRDAYNRHFTGRFAAALFYDKSAAHFADPNTLVVDLGRPSASILEMAMLREEERFYDCLIVTDGEKLLGVLTIRDLMTLSQLMQKEAYERRSTVVRHSLEGVGRIGETVQDASKEAGDSVRLTRSMKELAGRGKSELEDVLISYHAVTSRMERQQGQVTNLAQLLDDIAGMASSIHALADHSTLLAINASIEAAHAGVHGRGFQIVSQEVRKMALETRHFSTQISGLLEQVGKLATETSDLTEASVKEIHNGSRYIQAGTETFGQLLGTVTEIEDKNGTMALTAGEAATQAASIANELTIMLDQKHFTYR